MSPIIRPETSADHAAIGKVNRLAFGGEGEAGLVDALRAGGYARISLVAEEDGRIIGHILFSTLTIATPLREIEALSLAPMAVVPSHQRRGSARRWCVRDSWPAGRPGTRPRSLTKKPGL